MRTPEAVARVRAAQAELDAAHAALARDTVKIERSIRERQTTWILAGGFLGGFALGFLPTRAWSRIGAVVGGSAALAARSVLTPMIAGALLARVNPQDDTTS